MKSTKYNENRDERGKFTFGSSGGSSGGSGGGGSSSWESMAPGSPGRLDAMRAELSKLKTQASNLRNLRLHGANASFGNSGNKKKDIENMTLEEVEKAISKLEKLIDKESNMSANKVGNRNNSQDRERIRKLRQMATDFVSLTMELEPTDIDLEDVPTNAAVALEKTTMNKKIDLKAMKDMGGQAYAHNEAWDIAGTCDAIRVISQLVHSEISYDEPNHVSQLAEVMRGLVKYLSAEIDEMESASKEDTVDGYAMMNTTVTDTTTHYGDITIANPVEVKQEKSSLKLDYVKSLGLETIPDLACKFVAKDEIKGYAILWGDANKVDLEHEYFTKDTNFWDNKPQWLTWDHAQDEQFKSDPRIGNIVEVGDDEWGKWYIAKLKKAENYRKYLDNLIANKAVGSSSDSAPQYVKRVKTGKSIWLKEWPLFAVSLTDNPCEPRMIGSLEFLKSLGINIQDAPQGLDGDKAILDYFKYKYKLGD